MSSGLWMSCAAFGNSAFAARPVSLRAQVVLSLGAQSSKPLAVVAPRLRLDLPDWGFAGGIQIPMVWLEGSSSAHLLQNGANIAESVLPWFEDWRLRLNFGDKQNGQNALALRWGTLENVHLGRGWLVWGFDGRISPIESRSGFEGSWIHKKGYIAWAIDGLSQPDMVALAGGWTLGKIHLGIESAVDPNLWALGHQALGAPESLPIGSIALDVWAPIWRGRSLALHGGGMAGGTDLGSLGVGGSLRLVWTPRKVKTSASDWQQTTQDGVLSLGSMQEAQSKQMSVWLDLATGYGFLGYLPSAWDALRRVRRRGGLDLNALSANALPRHSAWLRFEAGGRGDGWLVATGGRWNFEGAQQVWLRARVTQPHWVLALRWIRDGAFEGGDFGDGGTQAHLSLSVRLWAGLFGYGLVHRGAVAGYGATHLGLGRWQAQNLWQLGIGYGAAWRSNPPLGALGVP